MDTSSSDWLAGWFFGEKLLCKEEQSYENIFHGNRTAIKSMSLYCKMPNTEVIAKLIKQKANLFQETELQVSFLMKLNFLLFFHTYILNVIYFSFIYICEGI